MNRQVRNVLLALGCAVVVGFIAYDVWLLRGEQPMNERGPEVSAKSGAADMPGSGPKPVVATPLGTGADFIVARHVLPDGQSAMIVAGKLDSGHGNAGATGAYASIFDVQSGAARGRINLPSEVIVDGCDVSRDGHSCLVWGRSPVPPTPPPSP